MSPPVFRHNILIFVLIKSGRATEEILGEEAQKTVMFYSPYSTFGAIPLNELSISFIIGEPKFSL